MTDETFQDAIDNWKQRATLIDEKLAPIVNVGIDINDPDWEAQILNRPHPADVAGLRRPIGVLFHEIIEQFEFFSTDQRYQIIDLMYQHEALMYSAIIDSDRDTPEGFRKHMIFFVIQDQGKDTRDAILALGAYHADASAQGIDVASIFQDMAAIASRRDKFGWGTTRDLFLNYLK